MTDFYGSCLACTAGKMHSTDLHVTSSSPPSTNIGECVFFDLQLLTTASIGGNTQALNAIDDRSGYISVLRSKSKDKHDISLKFLPDHSLERMTARLCAMEATPPPADAETAYAATGDHHLFLLTLNAVLAAAIQGGFRDKLEFERYDHGKKVDKTLTVHVELGKTSFNFRSRS